MLGLKMLTRKQKCQPAVHELVEGVIDVLALPTTNRFKNGVRNLLKARHHPRVVSVSCIKDVIESRLSQVRRDYLRCLGIHAEQRRNYARSAQSPIEHDLELSIQKKINDQRSADAVAGHQHGKHAADVRYVRAHNLVCRVSRE